MFIATFQLPLNDNTGRMFPVEVIAGLLVDFADLAGGLTLRAGTGFCRSSPNQWDMDTHVEVEVWTANVQDLCDLVERARISLDQDSIVIKISEPKFVKLSRSEVRQ